MKSVNNEVTESQTWGEVKGYLWGEQGVLVRQRMIFEIKPMIYDHGKPWVIVTILPSNTSFAPSFEDLYYIVKGIGQCEQTKYKGARSLGKHMVWFFLEDVIWSDSTYEELAKKYNLPNKGSPRFIPLRR